MCPAQEDRTAADMSENESHGDEGAPAPNDNVKDSSQREEEGSEANEDDVVETPNEESENEQEPKEVTKEETEADEEIEEKQEVVQEAKEAVLEAAEKAEALIEEAKSVGHNVSSSVSEVTQSIVDSAKEKAEAVEDAKEAVEEVIEKTQDLVEKAKSAGNTMVNKAIASKTEPTAKEPVKATNKMFPSPDASVVVKTGPVKNNVNVGSELEKVKGMSLVERMRLKYEQGGK